MYVKATHKKMGIAQNWRNT